MPTKTKSKTKVKSKVKVTKRHKKLTPAQLLEERRPDSTTDQEPKADSKKKGSKKDQKVIKTSHENEDQSEHQPDSAIGVGVPNVDLLQPDNDLHAPEEILGDLPQVPTDEEQEEAKKARRVSREKRSHAKKHPKKKALKKKVVAKKPLFPENPKGQVADVATTGNSSTYSVDVGTRLK